MRSISDPHTKEDINAQIRLIHYVKQQIKDSKETELKDMDLWNFCCERLEDWDTWLKGKI